MRERRNPTNVKPAKGKKRTSTVPVPSVPRAEAERLKAVFDAIGDGLILLGIDRKITSVNPAFEKISGYKKSELVGKDATELISKMIKPEDMKNVMAGLGAVLEGKIPPSVPLTIITKDGRELSIISTTTFMKDAEGKPTTIVFSARDITELRRKTTESELAAKEWQETFDAITDIVALISPDFEFIIINRAGAEAIGKKPEELIGKKCHEVVHGLNAPIDGCPCKEMLKTKKAGVGEITQGGRHYIATASPVLDKNNELVAFAHTIRDITEQKRADEALRKRTHDFGERVKELNCLYGISNLVEKPGISLEEILQGTVDLIPPAWQYPEVTCGRIIVEGKEYKTKNFKETDWNQASDIVVHGKRIGAVEVCYLEERPESAEEPFLKEERNLINAIAERLGDITERKKAEEALKESEEKLRKMLDSSPDAITVTDLNGNIIECNPVTLDIHGFSAREKIIGRNAFDLIAPKDHQRAAENMEKTLKQGVLKNLEYTLLTKDGREFPGELSASVILDPSGKPTSFIAITKDITERKRAEERYRNLVELAPDGMVTLDKKGVITSWNTAASEMSGYSKDEIVGKHFSKLGFLRVRDIPKYLKIFTSILRGKSVGPLEVTWYHKDGTPHLSEMRVSEIKEVGKTAGFQVIARDITERKKVEEERIKAAAAKQRIAQLEKFARIAVGRELKMVELKKQIKALESKLKEKS